MFVFLSSMDFEPLPKIYAVNKRSLKSTFSDDMFRDDKNTFSQNASSIEPRLSNFILE